MIWTQLLPTLLDASVRSLLLAAGVAAALMLLRVRDPARRHLAWLGALCGMLILPPLLLLVPALPVSLPTQNLVHRVEEAADPQSAPAPPRAADTAPAAAPVILLGDPEAVYVKLPAAASLADSAAVGEGWHLLVWLYLAGLVAMALRVAAGWWLGRRLAAGGEPLPDDAWQRICRQTVPSRRVELRLHSAVRVPLCLGWRRPTILLPPSWHDWPEAKRRSVLAHELQHVRRGDALSQLLGLVNRCLYWFHPLAWSLPRRLALLAEEACDGAALEHSDSRQHYARCLLEVAGDLGGKRRRLALTGLAMAGSADSLRQRIRSVLDPRRSSVGALRRRTVWTVLAATLLVAAGLAALQLSFASSTYRAAPSPAAVAAAVPAVEHRAAPATERRAEPATSHRPASVDAAAPGGVFGMPASWSITGDRQRPERPAIAAVSSPRATGTTITPAATLVAAPVDRQPRHVLLFFYDVEHTAWPDEATRAGVRVPEEASRWLDENLSLDDRVAVLSYRNRLRIHLDFSDDPHAIRLAVDAVRHRNVRSAQPGERLSLVRRLPRGKELKRASRDVFDALELVARATAEIEGDKSLFLLTAGFGRESRDDAERAGEPPSRFRSAVASLQASGVAVQTLDVWPRGGHRKQHRLARTDRPIPISIGRSTEPPIETHATLDAVSFDGPHEGLANVPPPSPVPVSPSSYQHVTDPRQRRD